eukprot:2277950-Pyramimonas_sp.AAC.1
MQKEAKLRVSGGRRRGRPPVCRGGPSGSRYAVGRLDPAQDGAHARASALGYGGDGDGALLYPHGGPHDRRGAGRGEAARRLGGEAPTRATTFVHRARRVHVDGRLGEADAGGGPGGGGMGPLLRETRLGQLGVGARLADQALPIAEGLQRGVHQNAVRPRERGDRAHLGWRP